MRFESSVEAAKVEILSRQNVKPSIATPQQLKIYRLSVLDQFSHHTYIGSVHFYLNNDLSKIVNEEVVLTSRREILKKSLSRTLSHFYPLAGELSEDGLNIECNDNGVYYVEARVRDQLSDFLTQPQHNEINRLLPFNPESPELKVQTYMVMIQVNIFNCGGIALGIHTSHKLVDGHTHITFLKAWAAQARGSAAEQIYPDLYTAESIFVQDPTMPKHFDRVTRPESEKLRIKSTRRFVFNASDLAALKAKTGASSRVLAVMGLVWKCGMSASQKIFGFQKPSCLLLSINLRPRIISRPPLSPYSIGNLFWLAHVHPMPNDTASGLKLGAVMESLRDSIAQFKGERFVKLITGEKGSANFGRIMEELTRTACVYNEVEHFAATSLCNGGIYQADFGWGKQIWTTFAATNVDLPGLMFLMDTRSGDGIEALVTLDEPNMKILEKDPEILAFATLEPSPLQIDNSLPRAHL